MHASIALCLMFVGGPVAPGPDSDIISLPLKDDFTRLNAMQDLEWKVRIRNGYKLPRVPTVVDDTRSRDDSKGMGRRYGQSTDPNAQHRQQQMPFAPTDPGALGQNGTGQGVGPMPGMPGSGLGQGNSQGYSQNGTGGYDPSATDRLAKPVGGYGPQQAPRSAYVPTASDSMNGIMNRANAGNYGASPNPYQNTSVGGGDKPFSGYQRPNGYSPWMRLYDTPTNGGTVSPYSAAVQPAIQQQQYNQQVAEQIKDVRSGIVGPRSGTPGQEMPVNGAGLANPYGYINYGNPMGK